MFEILMDALEVLQGDETVVDVLNTVGALTLALADKILSPSKYKMLSMFNVEAATKIKEIIKQGDNKNV